jgi:hypothetical protein
MPDHVGEALLGDAVDDELDLGLETRERGLDLPGDSQSGALRHLVREVVHGRDEPELVERLGPQSADEAAGVLDALLGEAPGVDQRVTHVVGGFPRGALDGEQQRREGLAQVVVELRHQPPALGLLRGQRAPGAVAPLALEAIEHVVERVGDEGHLRLRAPDGQPPTGLERVDAPHEEGQSGERGERMAHEQEVHQRHDGHAGHQDGHAAVRRLELEEHASSDEHHHVRYEEPPEQGDVPARELLRRLHRGPGLDRRCPGRERQGDPLHPAVRRVTVRPGTVRAQVPSPWRPPTPRRAGRG